MRRYRAVLFDLLTAVLDSWSLWDAAAGSIEIGRRWRAAYLRRIYGCGAYRPYETLVAEAAAEANIDPDAVLQLEQRWTSLAPWSGVRDTLAALRAAHRLAVVTNCSERLGHVAADLVGIPFDVIVTAERAGFYKPDPRPYRLALDELGVDTRDALFVAGSGYDLFGTAAVGLDTYWHNRIGLPAPQGAPAAMMMSREIEPLLTIVRS
ncbi:MAG TPA: HAD-IA family hydrolase [Vineibacter sp.]|nr:HAD-IA family hydrolase [Vineibacter sp.]